MTDPTQAERERWEPDRALADLDTMALRERVQKCEKARRELGQFTGAVDLHVETAYELLSAALADHREDD